MTQTPWWCNLTIILKGVVGEKESIKSEKDSTKYFTWEYLPALSSRQCNSAKCLSGGPHEVGSPSCMEFWLGWVYFQLLALASNYQGLSLDNSCTNWGSSVALHCQNYRPRGDDSGSRFCWEFSSFRVFIPYFARTKFQNAFHIFYLDII